VFLPLFYFYCVSIGLGKNAMQTAINVMAAVMTAVENHQKKIAAARIETAAAGVKKPDAIRLTIRQ
jgi:hypothetical protein